MPQLAIETFVTQYFWLVVIFISFYFIIAAIILPKISTIIKTRSKLANIETQLDQIESDTTVLGKSIISQAFSLKPTINTNSSNYDNLFNTVNNNWIKSSKKNKILE